MKTGLFFLDCSGCRAGPRAGGRREAGGGRQEAEAVLTLKLWFVLRGKTVCWVLWVLFLLPPPSLACGNLKESFQECKQTWH